MRKEENADGFCFVLIELVVVVRKSAVDFVVDSI